MLYSFADFTLDTDRRELRQGADTIAVTPQVFEQVKNLRCDRHRIHPPMQFAPFRIKCVILEEITQAAIPSRGPL